MQHYVCTGDCGLESPRAGMCDTDTCSKEGQPLVECSCEDGFHEDILQTVDDLDIESMDDEDSF